MAVTKKQIEINKKIDRQAIMNATLDCYSRDRYGDKAWDKSIKLLQEEGLTPLEIITVLDSKYMRWAADTYASFPKSKKNLSSDDEILKGDEIIQYKNKGKWDISAETMGLTKELLAEYQEKFIEERASVEFSMKNELAKKNIIKKFKM